VECDPSIKSIIVKIDSEEHAYVVEELDDQTLVVQENMLPLLKARLDDVSTFVLHAKVDKRLIGKQALKETQQPADDSGSD
jgi:TFIIH basal transcription factor complex TTD-A subunit